MAWGQTSPEGGTISMEEYTRMPIRVTALDHIVLNVRDVERSLAFYSQQLGLPAERVDQWRTGQVRFPSLRVNEGTIIDLVQVGSREAEGRQENLAHYCMVVDCDDMRALRADLEAVGVPVTDGPKTRSGARGEAQSIYLRDPDQNEIELRSYAPQPGSVPS